jgi:hypothetical protein
MKKKGGRIYMNGIKGLQNMLSFENTEKDFADAEMDQLVNADIRDNHIDTMQEAEDPTTDDLDNLDNPDAVKEDDDACDDTEDDADDISEEADDILDEINEGFLFENEDIGKDTVLDDETDNSNNDELSDLKEEADEEELEDIPDGSEKEVAEFWAATDEDGSFEQQVAIESQLASLDKILK